MKKAKSVTGPLGVGMLTAIFSIATAIVVTPSVASAQEEEEGWWDLEWFYGHGTEPCPVWYYQTQNKIVPKRTAGDVEECSGTAGTHNGGCFFGDPFPGPYHASLECNSLSPGQGFCNAELNCKIVGGSSSGICQNVQYCGTSAMTNHNLRVKLDPNGRGTIYKDGNAVGACNTLDDGCTGPLCL